MPTVDAFSGPVSRVHVGHIQFRPSALYERWTPGWGHHAVSSKPSRINSLKTCWCERFIATCRWTLAFYCYADCDVISHSPQWENYVPLQYVCYITCHTVHTKLVNMGLFINGLYNVYLILLYCSVRSCVSLAILLYNTDVQALSMQL